MDTKKSQEELFREDLESVLTVVEKMSSVCQTPKEMAQMIALALENNAQLRVLMMIVQAKNEPTQQNRR